MLAVLVPRFSDQRNLQVAISHVYRRLRGSRDQEMPVVSVSGPSVTIELWTHDRDAVARLRFMGATLAGEIKAMTGSGVWIGAATTERVDALGRARREAGEAARLAAALGKPPGLILYDDVLHVAAIQAQPSIRAGLAALIAPLMEVPGGDRLAETLEAFLSSNLSRTVAARSLGIHRHTLTYRLRRVEELLGRSILDGADRLLVECAMLAYKTTTSVTLR